MRELERVCAAGGEVILVNHFSQEEGLRGLIERKLAPFANLIGWHSVFSLDKVMVCEDLDLAERRALRPFGLFTMLRFVKQPGYGLVPDGAGGRQREAEGARAGQVSAAGAGSGQGQVAGGRTLVVGRRFLDTHYWRSLYRRLASQMAE